MESPVSFAALLRERRRAAKLTQETLAERAGLSSRTISDLERGIVRAPRADTLLLLAAALDLPAPERQEWDKIRQRLSRRAPRSKPATVRQVARRGSFWNVPVPLSALIGRQAEIAAVTTTLHRLDVRLLTLTGVGGVGKTRLAIAAAQSARDGFPGGVAFVSLAAFRDPDQMLEAVAAALDVQEVAGQTLRERLVGFLAGQPVLLVLDNFEQILDAAVDVNDLLVRCPELTVLVTGRIPLRLQGEHLFPVEPMSLSPVSERASADDVTNWEAPALFIQRARSADPRFELTADNAAAIVEICQRLDGLPLAIELAAARVTVLPPARLVDLLDRRLPLLTGGARDAPERQRTLRNTIAWSYELLTAEQRALFRQLSVFSGGWSLEGASVVAGQPAATDAILPLLDDLSALVAHNLVRQVTGHRDDARFGMLETIREFGVEALLESGDAASVRRRHADYYLDLAERADTQIDGPDQIDVLAQLDQEHSNLLAALGWLGEQGDVEGALRLGASLGRFWMVRGHNSMGLARLAPLLNLPGAERPTFGRGIALRAIGMIHGSQGNYRMAIEALREAVDILEEHNFRSHLPRAYVGLGIVLGFDGNWERSLAIWEKAADVGREVGDYANVARALTNLGHAVRNDGDREAAIAYTRDGLSAARRSGNPTVTALATGNLGSLLREQGDHSAALALTREALALQRDAGHTWGIAAQLESLARILHQRGQTSRAAMLAGTAATVLDAIGTPVQPQLLAEHEAFIATLEAEMGPDFEVAWAAGAELTLEEAVALGLGEADQVQPRASLETA